MILSWIKADGTKFMAHVNDMYENNLMQFCKVHNARPLNEDELKKHNTMPKTDDKPQTTPPQNPQITPQKKKWWKR